MLGASVENMFSQCLGGDPCSPVIASWLKQEGGTSVFYGLNDGKGDVP